MFGISGVTRNPDVRNIGGKIMKPSNIDRLVFRIAGVFVLASLALGYFVHPAWFLFTAFVGLNMFQASFTGFCPMAKILKKAGVRAGEAFSE